ncbi:Transcription termination/antitermination protein NusA [bacterium HR32]|jgi:N utilization substance protein A|nr:Transcription termination/antitermination protein NusA [bacterium HR32]
MNGELIRALEQLEEERGISKSVLLEAVESALVSAYKKNFGGTGQNVRVEVDPRTGEIRVFSVKTVVERVQDPATELSLEEMRKEDPTAEVGDVVEEEITPKEFGRIAAQAAKQVVVQRIREAEREMVKREFEEREKQVVTGQVQRVEKGNVYVDLGHRGHRVEGVLSKTEQIPRESYRQGERIKVYVMEVRDAPRGPQIHVSRAHPGLVRALFEQEVPEIREGIVVIQNVAREPGARTKIAVYSRDRNVDPVGACVGPKGSRVQAVVDELRGEKVDIVPWSPDPAQFVASALQPAKVVRVEIDEETKTARVIVPDNQLSLAIGREGQNARLAAKLTGWRIDIKSETQVREQEAAKLFVDLTPEELAQFTSPQDGEANPAERAEGPSEPAAQG